VVEAQILVLHSMGANRTGGASGATGYLVDEAAGFALRSSEDRKAGRQTNISGEPEHQAEEAQRSRIPEGKGGEKAGGCLLPNTGVPILDPAANGAGHSIDRRLTANACIH
jgi:hypothetical protein